MNLLGPLLFCLCDALITDTKGLCKSTVRLKLYFLCTRVKVNYYLVCLYQIYGGTAEENIKGAKISGAGM